MREEGFVVGGKVVVVLALKEAEREEEEEEEEEEEPEDKNDEEDEMEEEGTLDCRLMRSVVLPALSRPRRMRVGGGEEESLPEYEEGLKRVRVDRMFEYNVYKKSTIGERIELSMLMLADDATVD